MLLFGPEQSGHICALFASERGSITTGWVERRAIKSLEQPAITAEDWLGKWKAIEQDIEIKRLDGQLSLTGLATWGAFDPARVARGDVHDGAFTAKIPFSGADLTFTDGQGLTLADADPDPTTCRVHLSRRGPYLAATDNGQCGGLNVTFTGVYRRVVSQH